ncbi:hypothetical protein BXU11_08895 [Flavobacterium sp. LM5]|uniref:restriction endonuclease subunit S n=1 Tax=Flavobacterium sp. LM5 TaxID=1938610 RepID=UPI00099246F2|nr:restriction endonuclease subunit S [Flavobacterium sp. LM5]OOV27575.1 hypothetical protein BXU11_08895 [Flavobacterium sp. LM5]
MNKLKVPQLRFPGFDGEWELNLLGNTCIVKTGGSDTQDRTEDGLYPFYVRSNTVERINTFSYDGEAILTSGDGVGVGKNFHYINGKFDYHQRVYALREFKKDYSGKFIYQVFKEQFYKRVIKLSAKNSVDSVRMSMITEMEISFPTLPEQQKIASFLSAVDEKIQQLSRKKELLEQYKKGAMQQLFSGKLRFKDENGKDYPDWEEKKLGEVLKIGSGKDYKHLDEGNIPVFGTGGYMLSVNKFLHSGETVFIGRKGTIDKPFYFKGDFWTVDTLFYTHSFKNTIPKFIYCVFQQINWKLHNEASGVPSLSKSTIEKLRFDFPCIPEQQKIANFLSSIDAKIENTHSELEKTQGFKKGLLQKMFV